MKHIKKFTTNEHFYNFDLDEDTNDLISDVYDSLIDSEEFKKLQTLELEFEEKIRSFAKEKGISNKDTNKLIQDIFYRMDTDSQIFRRY